MSNRVPEVFADGLSVDAALTSTLFATDPLRGTAELDGPSACVYDSDQVPAGPPPTPARGPLLILCGKIAPQIQTALVVRKLRGVTRVAIARCEQPELLAKLLGSPVIRAPGGLAEARSYVPLSRCVATVNRSWLWLGQGRSIPPSTCEELVLPRSDRPLQASFDAWTSRKDQALNSGFALPGTPAMAPAPIPVECFGARPKSGRFDGSVGLVEEPFTAKGTSRLIPVLKKWPGPLLLVVTGIDPAARNELRAGTASLPIPLLLSAAESAEELEDLALATGAQVLCRDLGLTAADLTPRDCGRITQAELVGDSLSFQGAGDSSTWLPQVRRINAEYLLSETAEERERWARRGARFLSLLPGSARTAATRF
jgi:hypothetical protein